MKKLMTLIFLATSLNAFSQKQGIRFEHEVFDYGQVNQWNNPPAAFLFANTGSREIMFLPTFKRDDIFAELPKGKIKPGASDTVFIYYFTSETGEFQKSIDLYTGESNMPIKLTVKGNILSLDPKAFMSCPGFAPKLERVDELALILDSVSPQPQKTAPKAEVIALEKAEAKELPARTIMAANDALPLNQYVPNNIVFLIDVSSSMKKPDKLPLLKTSMKNLAKVLRGVDYISVVTYSTKSTVLLSPTAASSKGKIISIIDTLTASGMTNGGKGLQTAYDIAEHNLIPGGNNQIIIATDGLFNSPNFSKSDLYALVRQKAKDGVKLSVVGFGKDEEALQMLGKMAEKGSGSFIQIPDAQAANKILIEEVKLQSAITRN